MILRIGRFPSIRTQNGMSVRMMGVRGLCSDEKNHPGKIKRNRNVRQEEQEATLGYVIFLLGFTLTISSINKEIIQHLCIHIFALYPYLLSN